MNPLASFVLLAAISGAGGGLWVAHDGHDMYQRWFEAELGLPWENRELWEQLSPWNEIESLTTPTMWVGGEDDWNVPILGSEHMYIAAKRRGIEALLVVYPRGGPQRRPAAARQGSLRPVSRLVRQALEVTASLD